MENRVRFKIGEIEFEAEGNSEIIERERQVFINSILPEAVEAIVRTRNTQSNKQYSQITESDSIMIENSFTSVESKIESEIEEQDGLSRTNLVTFLKKYGTLDDQDFVLISAYFDEKKNNIMEFTSENVKRYYAEARRTEYSNINVLLTLLIKKGHIMDAVNSDGGKLKKYTLTSNGLAYIEAYVPKEESTDKKTVTKSRKARKKVDSIYANLCADDFNINSYPEPKNQVSFKKQMMLILYIVDKEGHGDSFSILDIQFLMTDIWGLPATDKQIQGVFDRHKTWFKKEIDENNKKACKHKLLQGAKDFGQSIIDEA